jgi:hypothetical protein
VSGSGSHTAKEAAQSTLAQSTLAFPPTDFGVFSDSAAQSVAATCNEGRRNSDWGACAWGKVKNWLLYLSQVKDITCHR